MWRKRDELLPFLLVVIVFFVSNQQILSLPCSLPRRYVYRLDLATRSSSSFFLMAYELEEPLAALMSSSARHSATDLMLRKAASRAPMVRRAMAWLTRRRGETSTAWRRTVPAEPIRVESSRGPQLTMASTAIWMGFWSAMIFFPLLRPFIMRALVRRSMMGHWALRNLLEA